MSGAGRGGRAPDVDGAADVGAGVEVGAGRGPVTVFAIDDHPAFLATVGLVVEATAGFEIVGTATSGEGALAALHVGGGRVIEPEPDLLLVDVVLPGISGPELVQSHRLAGSRAAVVLLSSYGPEDLPTEVVEPAEPSVGFLAKADLSPQTLRATWERLVRRSAADQSPL